MQIAKAGARVNRDLAACALLVGEGTLHVHEFADLQGCHTNVDTEQGTVEVQGHRRPTSEHRQAASAKSGLKVNKRGHLRALPVVTLVGGNAHLLALDFQEINAHQADEVNGGRQRPQVRHFLGLVAVEHHSEIQVIHGKANRVLRRRIVSGDVAITVAVHKIGA